MENLFSFTSKRKNTKVFGFELLSENEMLKVRGGTVPIKPKSRPKDEYDFEEE